MQDPIDAIPQATRREPWNKGKLVGAKPPLGPKHVWSIRTKLQIAGRTRDLGDVQSRHRQQAPRMRRRQLELPGRAYFVDQSTVPNPATGMVEEPR